MRNFFKYTMTVALVMSFIGAIGASEPERDPEKTHILTTNAMIAEEFSGIESSLIVRSFLGWMNATRGDILILPPDERDSLYYKFFLKGDSPEFSIFEMDLTEDAKVKNPWAKECRQTFYVMRITSSHPVVKALDGEDRTIMAFTFSGCAYKFIAVVADRMTNEKMMYTTMLHELGHMWGMKDNKEGVRSIMNGSWPGAECITKRDLHEVYEIRGRKNKEQRDAGCD